MIANKTSMKNTWRAVELAAKSMSGDVSSVDGSKSWAAQQSRKQRNSTSGTRSFWAVMGQTLQKEEKKEEEKNQPHFTAVDGTGLSGDSSSAPGSGPQRPSSNSRYGTLKWTSGNPATTHSYPSARHRTAAHTPQTTHTPFRAAISILEGLLHAHPGLTALILPVG